MNRNGKAFTGAAIAILLAALFAGGALPSPEIRFSNELAKSGIGFVEDNSATPEKHQIETMTGGVAAFDFNHDGRIDLFFINGAQIPDLRKSSERYWNRLYRNEGDDRFTDVTAQAGVRGIGYSMGVAAGDYNNDGFEDLFIAGVNANQLLRNNGNGTFTDVTANAGVEGLDPKQGKLFSVGAGWLDYNNDGLLDLFVVNYVRWSIDHEPPCRTNNLRAYCSPDSFEGLTNTLYRNNGDGTFTDVSQSSGIGRVVGKGMGVAFADTTATAGPISSLPTTRSAICCFTTIAMAPSLKRALSRAWRITRTANPSREWAPTFAISITMGSPISSSRALWAIPSRSSAMKAANSPARPASRVWPRSPPISPAGAALSPILTTTE